MKNILIAIFLFCLLSSLNANTSKSFLFSEKEMLTIAQQYHLYHNVIIEHPYVSEDIDLRYLELDSIKSNKDSILAKYEEMAAKSEASLESYSEGCNIDFDCKDVSKYYTMNSKLLYVYCTSNASMLYEFCPNIFERIMDKTRRSFRYAKDNGYYIFAEDGSMLDLVEQKPEEVLTLLNSFYQDPAKNIEEAELLVSVYIDIWKERHTLVSTEDDLKLYEQYVRTPVKITKKDFFYLSYCFVNASNKVYHVTFKVFKDGKVDYLISEAKDLNAENKN
jgi:hypothetical protein